MRTYDSLFLDAKPKLNFPQILKATAKKVEAEVLPEPFFVPVSVASPKRKNKFMKMKNKASEFLFLDEEDDSYYHEPQVRVIQKS